MSLLAVFTTVSNDDQARLLADEAVAQRLAACVQTDTIQSVYRWQGAIEHEAEIRLVFKTTQARYPALAAWLAKAHPYALPALYALPVAEASAAYTAWVEQGCGGDADGA